MQLQIFEVQALKTVARLLGVDFIQIQMYDQLCCIIRRLLCSCQQTKKGEEASQNLLFRSTQQTKSIMHINIHPSSFSFSNTGRHTLCASPPLQHWFVWCTVGGGYYGDRTSSLRGQGGSISDACRQTEWSVTVINVLAETGTVNS